MSLALVVVSQDDFNFIYDHISQHPSEYRNLHLRSRKQVSKIHTLRYLHALHAPEGEPNVIYGVISGPGLFWAYRLRSDGCQTQIDVTVQVGSVKELARIERQFLKEILRRVRKEQEPRSTKIRVKYPQGEFYLRRANPGMGLKHRHCRDALTQSVLDLRFVSILSPWKLQLIHRQ